MDHQRQADSAVTRSAPKRLPAFRSAELELVNTMDRALDPYDVAVAALRHEAMSRRPVPDYQTVLRAERFADAVLAALHRRGMLA